LSRTILRGSNDQKTITEADLCAGFLHPSDIGLSFRNRTQELARELSLFPIAPPGKTEEEVTRKFAVAVGNAPADQLQKWMSDGVPHLLVENPDGASITVGPLVVPGQTPCARCIAMTKEDQNDAWREIAWQKISSPPLEVPVAVAHHVAGLVALELLRFIDEDQSQLIGNCTRINYHKPTQSEQRSYGRHPACGCNW